MTFPANYMFKRIIGKGNNFFLETSTTDPLAKEQYFQGRINGTRSGSRKTIYLNGRNDRYVNTRRAKSRGNFYVYVQV